MLSDLDYEDDMYLLAYHHSGMQAMAVELASTAAIAELEWVVGVCTYMRYPEAFTFLHM